MNESIVPIDPTFKSSQNLSYFAEHFLEAAIKLGGQFLACGGPVTRLESLLVAAGLRHGFQTTVNAMPSSISIFCYCPQTSSSYSRSLRVHDFSINLGQLRFVDKLLRQLSLGQVSSYQVLRRLDRIQKMAHPRVGYHPNFNIFGIGMGAGFLTGASFVNAFIAGAFTFMIYLIMDVIKKIHNFPAIFQDFLACFMAFFFGELAAQFLNVPGPLLSLGTLVYIVPGLLMTTAISEIVDQNYLSGSVRLLKALYTFMCMALAFYLAQDILKNIDWILTVNPKAQGSLAMKLLGATVIVSCSSLEFRAHPKSLLRILFCTFFGAISYFFISHHAHIVLASFIGAFIIGVSSLWLGRKFKHPSQIYSAPSLLILVPGMLAFSSFGYGQSSLAAEPFTASSLIQAFMISLAIVFGLAAGRWTYKDY